MRKKISWIIYFLTVTTLALLQTSFFPQFRMFFVKPDLLLLFVISVGLIKGYREGVIVGAMAAVLCSLLSWNLLGVYLLGYCLAGFVTGLVPERINADNFIVPLISGLAGTLGFSIIFFVAGSLVEQLYISWSDLYRILVLIFWNGLFSIPVFFVSKFLIIPPGTAINLDAQGIKSSYFIK
jgi:rod shape-determining protein MreD